MSKFGSLIMGVIAYCCLTGGWDMMNAGDLLGFGVVIIGLFAVCGCLALLKG